jgi:hypothetical protein
LRCISPLILRAFTPYSVFLSLAFPVTCVDNHRPLSQSPLYRDVTRAGPPMERPGRECAVVLGNAAVARSMGVCSGLPEIPPLPDGVTAGLEASDRNLRETRKA